MNDALATSVLEVERLTIEFASGRSYARVVSDLSLHLDRGEVVAIVGESGSGKSMLLQSILGVLRGRPGVVSGSVTVRAQNGQVVRPFEGIEGAVKLDLEPNGRTKSVSVARSWPAKVEKRARLIRGGVVGLALQNGRASLDPFFKIGRQIESAIVEKHAGLTRAEQIDRAETWLFRLGFHDPKRVAGSYPHELSGGMAQRAMLAVILAREPEILFLDEITTGLDVSLQAAVLAFIRELHEEMKFSALMVTHDLGMAQAVSSRILVMKRGRLMQAASTRELFGGSVPLHPYTAELLESRKELYDGRIPSTWNEAPVLRVESSEVVKHFAGQTALSGVSLWIHRGECLALVGESGSGKTTLSRILVGLSTPDQGHIVHDGAVIATNTKSVLDTFRRNRTILFQNPYTSLNPAMTAEGVIAEALEHYKKLSSKESVELARSLLEKMELGRLASQRLRALSGGERRRIGLMRAILSNADFIVLDEPTAGLDAVHRKRVAGIIRASMTTRATTMVIVSHDLGFVTSVADRIAVLYRGAIVEECAVADLLAGAIPQHAYTRRLWAAARFVGGGRWTTTQFDMNDITAPLKRPPNFDRVVAARRGKRSQPGGSHVPD